MEHDYTVTLDFPPELYGEIALLAESRGLSFNAVVVETLQTALASAWGECEYPEFPTETPPGWENHPRH
jgi:hypothetical protein